MEQLNLNSLEWDNSYKAIKNTNAEWAVEVEEREIENGRPSAF